jgi:hypothetical protein
MNHRIEIVISPTGQATVQTKGFSGPTCRDASKFLESALGQPVGEQLSAEFYQAATANHQTQQQRG